MRCSVCSHASPPLQSDRLLRCDAHMALSDTFVEYLRSLPEEKRLIVLGTGGAGLGALAGLFLAPKHGKTAAILGGSAGAAAGLTLGSSMDPAGVPGLWRYGRRVKKSLGNLAASNVIEDFIEKHSG